MITPMVARLVRDPFDREGWLFELKWDGFRAVAERHHGSPRQPLQPQPVHSPYRSRLRGG